ncbi:MAG TPA: peptidoglycan-binding protein, partial [Rhodanobacteraceae bacterium]|nr:peptidoglycan-binding protein [Rhodanobacteraceae bacterium]
YSRGLPRVLNTLGDRTLAIGAAAGETTIGESTVQRAVHESLHGHVAYWLRRYRWWWGAALVVLLLAAIYALSGGRGTPARLAALVDPQRAAQAEAGQLVQALPAADTAKLLAWSELLARWQVGSGEVGVGTASRCDAVIFPGFDCVGGTGTLDQLKRFDRPLVLELPLPDGPREVLLLGVGERQVRLDIGPRDIEISRRALQELWHGRFYAPFRLPASLPVSLRRGDSGSAVAWLDARLRRLDDDTASSYRPAIFDASVEKRVRKLQQGFGIPADGIVGPETLFALSSMDDNGPHLARNVP